MAAYGDLASLLNNIEQIMSHPRFSTSFDKNQIQSLHAKADDLLNFVITNNYGFGSKEFEDLERQISSAAQMAEDVIESHIVDQIHDESNRATLDLQPIIDENRNTECCDCVSWLKTWIQSTPEWRSKEEMSPVGLEDEALKLMNLQQIIEDMDAVLKRAAEVVEKWRMREEMSLTHQDMETAAERQPLSTIGEMSPVGLEDDALKLINLLCLDQPKRHLISIVGMGGSGKTTLARHVYDNLLVKEKFHIRAWATVSQDSQQYSGQDILSQLLSCLGKGCGNDLGQVLHQTLFGRKYLIILDDIWSVDPWNEVRHFFPDNGNGSRVVLTTRLSDVAKDCLSYSCLTMNLLDQDRSWKLLCKKAFLQENCPNLELEKIGHEIASLCKGLPLSIVGGLLLNSPRTEGFWEDFARNIKSFPNAKEKQESLDVLSLSYNHLPSHLKPCLLYMGVFKEDSVIHVSKIIKLWVSEGFVRPKGAQVLEEIAKDYLYDLISRNLILVDKFENDGRIGSFRIHDLIRDLCLNIGQQQDFFTVMIDRGNRGTDRRLICECLGWRPKIGPQLVRSIMARGNHMRLIRYKLLRVIDDGSGNYSYEPQAEGFGNVNLIIIPYMESPNLNH